MRGAGGVGLVAVGLILLWLAISGRLQCVSQFVGCVFSGATSTPLGINTLPTSGNGGNSTLNQISQTANQVEGIINFGRGLFGGATPQATPGISTQGTRL